MSDIWNLKYKLQEFTQEVEHELHAALGPRPELIVEKYFTITQETHSADNYGNLITDSVGIEALPRWKWTKFNTYEEAEKWLLNNVYPQVSDVLFENHNGKKTKYYHNVYTIDTNKLYEQQRFYINEYYDEYWADHSYHPDWDETTISILKRTRLVCKLAHALIEAVDKNIFDDCNEDGLFEQAFEKTQEILIENEHVDFASEEFAENSDDE